MHAAALDWIGRQAPQRPCRVLDVGGRDINGTPRHLFHPSCQYTVVDVIAGPNVDVVADFADYNPPDTVDVVVFAEVAEHTARWKQLIGKAWSLLSPGGVLVFTAAGEGRTPHSALDGGELRDGEWYENVTAEALADALVGFDGFEIDEHGEDIRAVAWLDVRSA